MEIRSLVSPVCGRRHAAAQDQPFTLDIISPESGASVEDDRALALGSDLTNVVLSVT